MTFGNIPVSDDQSVSSGSACEACPLDVSESDLYESTYAFTVAVSPKKTFKGCIKYGSLGTPFQKDLIRHTIEKSMKAIGRSLEDYVVEYELTKSGHIHAHGMVKCTDDQIDLFKVSVHKTLGFPKLNPDVCCKCVKTLCNPERWREYMIKDPYC